MKVFARAGWQYFESGLTHQVDQVEKRVHLDDCAIVDSRKFAESHPHRAPCSRNAKPIVRKSPDEISRSCNPDLVLVFTTKKDIGLASDIGDRRDHWRDGARDQFLSAPDIAQRLRTLPQDLVVHVSAHYCRRIVWRMIEFLPVVPDQRLAFLNMFARHGASSFGWAGDLLVMPYSAPASTIHRAI